MSQSEAPRLEPPMPAAGMPKMGMPPGEMPIAGAPDMPPAGAPKGLIMGGPKAGPGPGMLRGLPDAPPISFRKLFVWALAVVGTAWVGFLLATGLETARKLLTQYNAKLLGGVINGLRGGDADHAGLASYAALFAGLSVALIGLQFASQIASVWVDSDMVRRLQQKLHDKLLGLGPAYHDSHDSGRTQMVVMSFAAGAQPTLKQFISFPLVDGIALAGALYLLFQQLNALASIPVSIDVVLAAVLIVLPVAGYFLSRRVGRASAANIRARQGLNTEFLNSAQMPAEVQVMGAAPQRSRAFAQRLAEAVRAQRRATVEMQLASQFQDAVPTLLETGFVLYAVFVVLATGSAQVGAIVTILLLVPQVVAPIRDIISYLTGLSAAWPMVAEVGELLDATPDSPAGGEGFPDDATPAVAFEDVTFAYTPAQPPVVLHVTHLFRAGITTAVVGRSGAGKSSILRLIAGQRAPDTGRVSIAGVAIRDIDPTELRAAVVTVSQFPLFITDTVRANFLLGDANATDTAIEAAAQQTGLWPVLVRNHATAPLDAQMGPTGQGLSGGERRLFAITRALLRRPRILLLDEPTTGIDAIGVDLLEGCLRQACHGITIVMVEHNLEFIERMANEVVCLEAGAFTAVGPPAVLAAGDTLFARLLQIRRGLGSTESLEIETVKRPVLGAMPARPP